MSFTLFGKNSTEDQQATNRLEQTSMTRTPGTGTASQEQGEGNISPLTPLLETASGVGSEHDMTDSASKRVDEQDYVSADERDMVDFLQRPIMDENGFLDERAMRRRARGAKNRRGRSVGPVMSRRPLSGNSSDEDDNIESEQEILEKSAEPRLTPEQLRRTRKRNHGLRMKNRTRSFEGQRRPLPEQQESELSTNDEYEFVSEPDESIPSNKKPIEKKQTSNNGSRASGDPEAERTTRSQLQQQEAVDN
jgi:hypothetical protein